MIMKNELTTKECLMNALRYYSNTLNYRDLI